MAEASSHGDVRVGVEEFWVRLHSLHFLGPHDVSELHQARSACLPLPHLLTVCILSRYACLSIRVREAKLASDSPTSWERRWQRRRRGPGGRGCPRARA
eukprot:767174-Hanusia_phi.AAC.9